MLNLIFPTNLKKQKVRADITEGLEDNLLKIQEGKVDVDHRDRHMYW